MTDEVATLMLTEEGSGTVLSIENQHLHLIITDLGLLHNIHLSISQAQGFNVERAVERSPETEDFNDT